MYAPRPVRLREGDNQGGVNGLRSQASKRHRDVLLHVTTEGVKNINETPSTLVRPTAQ